MPARQPCPVQPSWGDPWIQVTNPAGRAPSRRTGPASLEWVIIAGALALGAGIAIAATLWLLARPLALLALGITIAEALSPIVAWLSRRMPRGAAVVLVFVILTLLPLIMRSQTKVSPLLVLLALFVGQELGGFLGAIVAIPLVSMLRVFVERVVAPWARQRTGAPSLGNAPSAEEGA